MRKVYFLPVASNGHIEEISTGAKKLFQHFIHEENIEYYKRMRLRST